MTFRCSTLLAFAVPAIWFLYFNQTPIHDFHIPHFLYLASSLTMLLIHTSTRIGQKTGKIRKIDCIVSSYSGNTAHYADHFIRGAEQAGAEVSCHRFHYYRDFQPELLGDALVIAFPIFGCKPPWPLLYYLCFRMPKGKSKPAFILYTCMGGAENAGILCWLILTLKGYRVRGRNWSVYPLNVPTFRLGPRIIWKWLDALSPIAWDVKTQVTCGHQFARGLKTGIPFIFGWTPCFLAGMLLDNKWVDRILYKNHVIKKRCDQCEICVQHCPAERLSMKNGYPKSTGECMICLGCVNLCPRNAMHLWCFTEYGNQYPPKYQEHIVRRKS
jgi:ferredoxin